MDTRPRLFILDLIFCLEDPPMLNLQRPADIQSWTKRISIRVAPSFMHCLRCREEVIADQVGTQLIHVDTTNFSVSGKYENDAPDATDSIRIAFGHAKDGKMDLKEIERFI